MSPNADPFQLTEEATLDIDAIWLWLANTEAVSTADYIVSELFLAFHNKLAISPGIGHRRADLTHHRYASSASFLI